MLKGLVLRSTLIAFICSICFAAHAMADPSVPVNVPPGDLSSALATLAKQSGVEFVYQADQVRGLRTGGVRGTYTAPDAVRILLKGTPLELRVDPTGAMLIAPPRAPTTDRSRLACRRVPDATRTVRCRTGAPPGGPACAAPGAPRVASCPLGPAQTRELIAER